MKNSALGAEVSKGADPGMGVCEGGSLETAWWHFSLKDFCAEDDCVGLFLDQTVSHSRRRKVDLR